jgi:hypothetical protein
MCNHCGTTNYRRIYIEHRGPIPIDDAGRKYDIHHIDGNRKNNSIDNLIAVSVEDHYRIHYLQHDYGACLKIAQRLQFSKEELSNLASLHNLNRVKNGSHPFVGGEIQRKRIEDGTHHFLNSQWQRENALKRVKNGTHHMLGASNPSHARVKNGTHNFQNSEAARDRQIRRIVSGKHHFLNRVQSAERAKTIMENGNHSCQLERQCPHCQKIGKGPSMGRWHFDRCKKRPN